MPLMLLILSLLEKNNLKCCRPSYCFDDEGQKALELGAYLTEIYQGTERLRDKIARMKYLPEDDLEGIRKLESEIKRYDERNLAEKEIVRMIKRI